jgi:hypothetical protein
VRNDDGKQLGRAARCGWDMVFMLPSVALVVLAAVGLFPQGTWWAGPIVVVGVTAILTLLVLIWQFAAKVEKVRATSMLGRIVKMVINGVLFIGIVVLLVFIFIQASVSVAARRWSRYCCTALPPSHALTLTQSFPHTSYVHAA